MVAVEYFKDDMERREVFVRTMVLDIINVEFNDFKSENEELFERDRYLNQKLHVLHAKIEETLTVAFNDPTKLHHENIHFCSECGEPTDEGYFVGFGFGDECYCSDACLGKHYTKEQWMMMCSNLDPEDPDDCEEFANMTEEERKEASGGGGEDNFYTVFDWRY